ncbi:MAG: hypothetical protein E6513_02445 [Lactobacillus johnsonii]|nr:hypothetical protein [Lactobacillus johnsonii]
MIKQIKEVQDAWRATQRTLDIKVVVNDKTYRATDINSLKYDSGAYTGDTFSIGSTYSNNVQIEFSHLVEGLKLGMEVRPSIGIKTSKGYIYEPLGVFIISSEIKMDRNNNLTSISASDRFCGLEGTYKSKLVYPAKVLDIIAEICAQSGVKANADDLARLPHQADLPIPISGQSYRKALGWIAQLYAGYATFDRQGLFTIRTIAEPNYELDPSQYEQAGLTKNEAPYKIGGIQCQTVITTKTRDGENTEETKTYQVGDTSGSQIKLENNIMTPDRLNNIWEQIKDISFYPFNLNWFGNPAIEVGDWLRLEDKQGNKFIVPNNSYTLDFNGGLSATSKADQTSSTDSAISWRGTYAQIIEELQARKAPDGTVIFPPSVVEPPKNAKPTDVWFKQNGNSTELWVFTAQEDGSGKWVRRDLTPDEIKKQVQEAQDGLKDAKKEIADNFAKADKDIAELNASIGNQNSKIEGLSTSVNTVVIPKVTDITNQVSDVVTKVSEQKNIVTGLQKQATQQGKDISKITTDVHGVTVDLANLNGDVNQTKATVQGLQTTLGNAQGDIAQIKVDAKKLSTSLSGKVDNSTYANFVSATNSALNAKLVASDLTGYAKTTDVEATANGLQVNINSLSGKLDNLVIGNRNLVRNSGFPKNTDYWFNGLIVVKHDFYYSNTKPLFCLKTNSSNEKLISSARFSLKRNTDYVVSFKGFASVNVSSYDVFILARKYGETNDYSTVRHLVDAKRLAADRVQYVKDLVFNSGENDEAYIRFDNNGSSDGNDAWLFFTEVKVEEGNKSTAWTPAPEDEQERVNGITSQLSARITANSQQFSSYYSKTDIDHKVSGVQSQITQNATGLQTVVAKVDNIRIGGTNLIRDSAMRADSHTAWQESGTVTWHVNSVEVSKGDLIQNIPAKPNTTYTFSFDLYYQDFSNAWANQFFFVEYTDTNFNKTTPKYVDHRWAGNQFPNTAGRKDKKLTFTTQGDCNGLKMYIRQEANQNPFHIFKLKLEEGNQATDWSPAPEDKANQSDYSALSQTVKGLQSTVSSNYGNLQSQISQTAGTIRNEITNKVSGVQSQITQNVNNLNLRINNTSRNLVLNSGNFQNLNGWYTNSIGSLTLGKHDFWKNSTENVLWINNPSKTNEMTVSSARFYVQPHTTYTISFYAFASTNVIDSDLYFLGRKKNSNKDFEYVIQPIAMRRYSPSKAEYITVTINTGESEEGYLRFDNNGSTDGNGNLLGITDVQMEEGSVATPWKPAINDQVLAQINVAAGTTLIQNDKIYMDASSTVFSGKAFIPDAAITTISADKINTGTLDAGRINVINLNANNITTGTIKGQNSSFNLTDGTLTALNQYNEGVFMRNGKLEFTSRQSWNNNSTATYGYIQSLPKMFTLGYNYGGLDINGTSGFVLHNDKTKIKTSNSGQSGSAVEGGSYIFGSDSLTSINNENSVIINAGAQSYSEWTAGISLLSGNASRNVPPSITLGSSNSLSDRSTVTISGSLAVLGSKNAAVRTSQGLTAINAYETAEYYFGDIGRAKTNGDRTVCIYIDPLFLETVNTGVPYHIFLTSYSEARIWVSEMYPSYFVIRSDKPNADFVWEIKAKRKGYENDRLKIIDQEKKVNE